MKNKEWRKGIIEGIKDKTENIKDEANLWLELIPNGGIIFKWAKRLTLIGVGVLITSTVTVTNREYNTMKKELTQKFDYRGKELQKY